MCTLLKQSNPSPIIRFIYLAVAKPKVVLQLRIIHSFDSPARMSDLEIELTAPNGRKYKQPTGLFINNEWVKSKKGEKITSINPTYDLSNTLN